MALIHLTKEQEDSLDEVINVDVLKKYQSVEAKILRTVQKEIFGNQIDFYNKDRGIMTGKAKAIKDGRIKHLVAEIKFRNLRGFTGTAWIPLPCIDTIE